MKKLMTNALCLVAAALLATTLVAPVLAATTVADGEYVIFRHNDALGSPRVVTDEQGRVIWVEGREAYGASLGRQGVDGSGFASNSVDTRIGSAGYTGHTSDRQSGLTYMKARHYDPVLGRFRVALKKGIRLYVSG